MDEIEKSKDIDFSICLNISSAFKNCSLVKKVRMMTKVMSRMENIESKVK